MSEPAPRFLDVDAFLAWGEGREGRFELHDGAVVAMSPERVAHLVTKHNVAAALKSAIRAAGLPCQALPDGATVRISKRTAYEPDALVHCGPPLPPDAIEIPDPLIVVEVLSPLTAAIDFGVKLEAYFSLASVAHYLIVDPDRHRVVHHARGAGDAILTRILAEGVLALPPGLRIDIASFFD